jgi:hypothetical protein
MMTDVENLPSVLAFSLERELMSLYLVTLALAAYVASKVSSHRLPSASVATAVAAAAVVVVVAAAAYPASLACHKVPSAVILLHSSSSHHHHHHLAEPSSG